MALRLIIVVQGLTCCFAYLASARFDLLYPSPVALLLFVFCFVSQLNAGCVFLS